MDIRNFIKKYWFLVIIPIALVVFITYMKGKDTLRVYDVNKGESVYTVKPKESEAAPAAREEMQVYTSDKIDLSMKVPSSWSGVIKSGAQTFIHSPSATAFMIQILDYYPQVNNVTIESLSEDLAAQGLSILNFERPDASSYFLYYQKSNTEGIVDYIDYVLWDRAHVVKITLTVKEAYLERLNDIINECFDSVAWNREDPIPDGVFLCYNMAGDFEFGVPISWPYSEADGAVFAMDEQTGAQMTVTFLESNASISDIPQTEYAQFLSSGKNSFMLHLYDVHSNSIYGEASYISQSTGEQIDMMQYYIADGKNHCISTFEFPDSVSGDYYDLFHSCLMCLRSFHVETGQTPDTSDSGLQSSVETEGIKTPEAGDNPETEKKTEKETEEDVATFADALVAVAGIPYESAKEINGIWESLNAGSPSNAKPIKESSEAYIIYIQTYEGNVYYMTVKKDGTLMKININSEDGPILYQQ